MEPDPRRFRRLQRLGIGVGLLLALIGGVSAYRTLTAPPGVGHFRSAESRREYLGHYQRAMQQLPQPTATYDVPTSYGIVRAYEWGTADGRPPVLLLPGRSSGVPMWTANLAGFADRTG